MSLTETEHQHQKTFTQTVTQLEEEKAGLMHVSHTSF